MKVKRELVSNGLQTVKKIKQEVGENEILLSSSHYFPSNSVINDGVKTERLTDGLDTDALKQDEPKIKVEIEEGLLKNEEAEPPANIFTKVDPEDESLGPANWAKMYNLIVDMRSKFVAPVDTQGCERIASTISPGVKHRDPKMYRFQLLISLMLSSQTKDEVNYQAMVNLQNYFVAKGYPGLCLQGILETSELEIDGLICKVGFHNRKAGYIKKSCEILHSEFNLDIPATLEDVVKLPGVGPKMGFLLLQNAWNINSGIGIDVHLHRLTQMWNWIPKTKNPEQSRVELEKWLPQKYWKQINPLLVGFGQVVCVPKANNCDICTLGKYKFCSLANRKLINKPMDEKRLEKLGKQRADLSKLINDI